MLKKLGVAAACGIALYGLARYINRNLVVVTSGVGQLLEPIFSVPDAPKGAGEERAASALATPETAPLPASSEAATTDARRTSDAQEQSPCP